MSEDTETPAASEGLVAAVEAVLFAAGEPVHPREIASAFDDATEDDIVRALEALEERYRSGPGGLRVERVANAVRLAPSSEVGARVRRFFRQRNRTRLSPAALETLAIVAYRQPVTAPEIQAVRGVDPSGAIKSLLEKKMMRILGRKKVVGNPLLYGTSKQFLVHFGLNRLEDLPSIEDFDQFLGVLEAAPAGLFEATPAAGPAGPDEEPDGEIEDLSEEE